jgi:predicted TPR repeat methyltransferase
VLLHQLGRSEEGVELVAESLERVTDNAGMWLNYGNINVSLGRLDVAEHAYLEARRLDPAMPESYCNLGTLYQSSGRRQEAREAFEKALELNPRHGETHHNYANLLRNLNEHDAAVEHYAKAADLYTNARGRAKALANMANALIKTGRMDEAERVIRDWIARDPDNPTAEHMLASVTGREVPARASDAYVTELFDVFAESFDEALGDLAYRGPKIVGEELRRLLGPTSDRVVLDAGCGTGLGLEQLRPLASRLVGVDLSPRMVEKARERGGYDELVVAELTSFLRERPGAFDVIGCIDTFCYFGDLEDVIGAAFGALRPGGILCFTVEKTDISLDGSGYRLEHHGRYAHQRRYVRSTLAAAGFADIEMHDEILRLEGGKGVSGLLVSARVPA